MSAVLEAEPKSIESLASKYQFEEPLNDGYWPEWFELYQSQIWKQFLQAPEPKRTDENWRFADLRAITFQGFQRRIHAFTHPSAIQERSVGFPEVAARFIFANNTLIHQEIFDLPEKVWIDPLNKVAKEAKTLLNESFHRCPVDMGSSKFQLLHISQLRGGLLIHLPPNVKVEKPIEIFHWVDGENTAIFPHSLIIIREGSSATIIEHFRSLDGRRAFSCGINDLHVEKNAKLRYFAVQDLSDSSLAYQSNSTFAAEGSDVLSLTMNFGAGYLRGESVSQLTGEGARSIMLSINPVSGQRVVDQRTQQNHLAPGASSDLLYLNSLDDQARTIFAGLIRVAEGAHRTDAYQKVRNLILSDDAEANSMPGLEINADQVRCTHGATSGEINEEELFYLAARGIPRDIARRMIVLGFFESGLERVEDEGIRKYLAQELRGHLKV